MALRCIACADACCRWCTWIGNSDCKPRPATKPQLGAAAINIVVLQAEDSQFGLIVDEITDTEEIVVKPLGKQLKGISAFSGATIMGDGRVALILDVPGLAQRAQSDRGSARVGSATKDSQRGWRRRSPRRTHTAARRERVGGPGGDSLVDGCAPRGISPNRGRARRLVRKSCSIAGRSFRWCGCRKSFPPPAMRRCWPMPARSRWWSIPRANRTVGLIVDRIVDIVEERAAVEPLAPRLGIWVRS